MSCWMLLPIYQTVMRAVSTSSLNSLTQTKEAHSTKCQSIPAGKSFGFSPDSTVVARIGSVELKGTRARTLTCVESKRKKQPPKQKWRYFLPYLCAHAESQLFSSFSSSHLHQIWVTSYNRCEQSSRKLDMSSNVELIMKACSRWEDTAVSVVLCVCCRLRVLVPTERSSHDWQGTGWSCRSHVPVPVRMHWKRRLEPGCCLAVCWSGWVIQLYVS